MQNRSVRSPRLHQSQAKLPSPGGRSEDRLWRPFLSALTVVAAGCMLMVPLAMVGVFPETHEVIRYPALLRHFSDACQAGVLYPRWLPHLAGGYGYPTFVFYQPLFFFLATGLQYLAGISTPEAIWLTCFLLALLGATGMYRLARLFADRPVSLFVTFLYVLTPYLFVDLYVRGDFSEFTSIQIVPWALFCSALCWRRAENRQPLLAPAGGLAAALVLVVVAHPIPAMATWGVIAVVLIALTWAVPRDARLRFVAAWMASFLLALVVSSVYWFPAVQLKSAVKAEAAFEGYFSTWRHVVHAGQLFHRDFGFGDSTLDHADDRMPFQLGLAHFFLAMSGAWFGRRNRLLIACFAAYLALILLMLPWSALLWRHLGLLRYFQFPWRLLAVIASLQAACCIGWASVPVKDANNRHLRSMLLGLLMVPTILWQSNQFVAQPGTGFSKTAEMADELFDLAPWHWQTYANVEEFLPRTATPTQPWRRNRPLLEVDQGLAAPMTGHSPYHLRFMVCCAVSTKATLNQYYFPGWRVLVDGREIPPTTLARTLTGDGRMTIALPASPDGGQVEAWYDGPPGSRIRCALALAAVAVFTGLMFWHDRRPRTGTDELRS